MQYNYTLDHKVKQISQLILENVSTYCIEDNSSLLHMDWSIDNLAILQDTSQFPFMLQYGETLINIILSNLGFSTPLNSAGMLIHNLTINKTYKKYGLINALMYLLKQDMYRVESLYETWLNFDTLTTQQQLEFETKFYPLPINKREKPTPPIIKLKTTNTLKNTTTNQPKIVITKAVQIKFKPITTKPKTPRISPIQTIAYTTSVIPEEELVGNTMAHAFIKLLVN